MCGVSVLGIGDIAAGSISWGVPWWGPVFLVGRRMVVSTGGGMEVGHVLGCGAEGWCIGACVVG